MIHNDSFLFNDLKLERKGAVDSDILRAILDKKGLTREGIRDLNKISGSAAIAAISSKYPGKLLLGRSGSPLVLASSRNQLIWSSEKVAIHQAMRPITWRFGLPFQANRTDLAFLTMNNESIYLFGDLKREELEGFGPIDNAIIWHEKFSSGRYYTQPKYDVHSTYKNARAKFYDEAKPRMVWCKTCKKHLELSGKLQELPLWKISCKTCKGVLGEKPEETALTILNQKDLIAAHLEGMMD